MPRSATATYPGIDLIYYGNQRQLEYDFVVSPGADPASILLDFQGAGKAALDRKGNIVMHTAVGDLRWHKPIAYQHDNGERRLVACTYARKEAHRLAFRLAAYDRAKPLIIDPALEYSTYLGGGGNPSTGHGEQGRGIAVDAKGNAYITGHTGSSDFPLKNAFQKNNRAFLNLGTNAFVAKFDAAGGLVYSTYLGGSGAQGCPTACPGDVGNAIAVDAWGNVYLTGSTGSSDFPTKNAFQNNFECFGGFSAFVTKLGAAGNALVCSTYLGGCSECPDSGNSIAVDVHGDAYVTGQTSSIPTKNAFQTELKGVWNAFVTKFTAGGNALAYSTYLGGSHSDWGNGIAVDVQGNAYVTGFTSSPDFPTKNAFQETFKTCPSCEAQGPFVTKLNAAGTALVYSTFLGATNGLGSQGNAIAVDRRGPCLRNGPNKRS